MGLYTVEDFLEEGHFAPPNTHPLDQSETYLAILDESLLFFTEEMRICFEENEDEILQKGRPYYGIDIEYLHKLDKVLFNYYLLLFKPHPIYVRRYTLSHAVERELIKDLRYVQATLTEFISTAKEREAKIRLDYGLDKAEIKALKDALDKQKVENRRLKQELAQNEDEILELQQEIKKLLPKANENALIGYVYLLQSASGAWKIGRTNNPNNRLKTFKSKLPFEVEYKHLIKTENMFGLERSLHNKFADKRLNGSEFFNLDPEDIEYICGL